MSHDHRHCADFARANGGLPAIEPGMPIPAGTGMSRRGFLLKSAGLALSVYGAGKLALPGAFEESIAMAADGAPKTVLVSIFLSGGADALSILAPYQDAKYQQLRPTLKLASGTPFGEDPNLLWNPAAQGLAQLHAAGKVTVMPAIGYASPNQSHFTSRHFWETGGLDPGARTGWLGRWLDVVGDPNNAIQGLSLDAALSPSLATSRVAVAATSSPTDYKFDSPGVWSAPAKAAMLESFGKLGGLPSADPITAQARQAQSNAAILRSQLASLSPDGAAAGYPDNGVATKLRGLAQMLAAGLPIRAVTLNGQGGYDTHSDQARALTTNLGATVDAIVAFQADIEARGLADRVLVHLWSEFGRRPQENGSSGTDHGAAGTGFLIGTRASGRMIGEFPGLTTLDREGNLRATSDFRALYASLVESWLGGAAASDVVPDAGSMPRYAVVK